MLVFIVLSARGIAQDRSEGNDENSGDNDRKPTPASLFGRIVDGKTGKGVEAVSVQVFKIKGDTLTTPDSLMAGMFTTAKGEFAFYNLSLPDSIRIRYTAVGYGSIDNTVSGKRSASANGGIDLGNVELASDAQFLNTVTVVGQRPALQMGIDRKTFNVDKAITTVGGTAVDLMKNIPTLKVDVDGNVQLRNASPQIFVDGRPTILTLDQIAANDIEKVELITNPSAKFDAASSGGIINIVMKKNRKLGINGLVSVGLRWPGSLLTGNLSLNVRQGKFNFFASGNYNQFGGMAKSKASRINKINGVASDYFNQVGRSDNSRSFRSVKFGVDYFINSRNTITISENLVKGRFSTVEDQEQQYLDLHQMLTELGQRQSDDKSGFTRSNTQFNYTHRFPKTGQELTADVTFNKGSRNSNTFISNYYFNPDGSASADPKYVRNDGNTHNDQLTVQVDYVNPISEDAKFEMGLRAFDQNNTTIFNTFSVKSQQETKLPLSSNVKYDESIYAAYTTYTNKWKGIGYQIGLRAEYTKFNGLIIDSAASFGYELPADLGGIFNGLFPSLYLTKELSEGSELQLNFSRRTRRPNFWQINPYIDIDDPLNISQGNPMLRPEYTNSFEFNYSKQYSSGSVMASIYYRNNQDDITRYSDTITAEQFQQFNNAAISQSAIVNTFINAKATNRLGAELTVQHRIGNLELVPSINLQYRHVKAVVGKLDLSNKGFNWESQLTVNYKLNAKSGLFKNLNFQLNANYESPEVIPQGRNKQQFETDVAIKKDFLKNNVASLTFAVDDLFNSDRFGQIYDTEDFYQDSYRQWNVRSLRLTFSYRFGKADLNMGKNKRREGDDD